MVFREERISRDLAHEPPAHVQAWLAAALWLLADPQTSARERAAAWAHVAACRQLLAPPSSPPTQLPADGADCGRDA